MFDLSVVVDAVAVDGIGQGGFIAAALAGEEESGVGGDGDIGSGSAFLGAFGSGNDLDVLFKLELARFEFLVNGNADALFITEVDEGEGGVVGHVAWAGAFRGIGVEGVEGGEVPGGGIELVLVEGVLVFDVGDVDEAVIG